MKNSIGVGEMLVTGVVALVADWQWGVECELVSEHCDIETGLRNYPN